MFFPFFLSFFHFNSNHIKAAKALTPKDSRPQTATPTHPIPSHSFTQSHYHSASHPLPRTKTKYVLSHNLYHTHSRATSTTQRLPHPFPHLHIYPHYHTTSHSVKTISTTHTPIYSDLYIKAYTLTCPQPLQTQYYKTPFRHISTTLPPNPYYTPKTPALNLNLRTSYHTTKSVRLPRLLKP